MERPVPVESASTFIDEKIKELGDWRGKMLAKVRTEGASPENLSVATTNKIPTAKLLSRGTCVTMSTTCGTTGKFYQDIARILALRACAIRQINAATASV
jgi:hypothetical protein